MDKDSKVVVVDDGLICPEVGRWAETKHQLVSLYAKLFSAGMKEKWDQRVYIELYSGAGQSRIKNTASIIAGSPLQALALNPSFDKYIFCEENPEYLAALKIRVKRASPSANVSYVSGNCDQNIDDVLAAIPQGKKGNSVLSLCFADPYDIGIKFETLRRLSIRYMDFLVLLALYMDANRNYERYVSEDAVKVDEFLGSAKWRERWKIEQWNAVAFPRFLAEEFAKSMQTLGYIPPKFYKMKEVKLAERNLPLYRLALFSRNERAYRFWDQVLKYSTEQTQLFTED